jgi:hypothetical protein
MTSRIIPAFGGGGALIENYCDEGVQSRRFQKIFAVFLAETKNDEIRGSDLNQIIVKDKHCEG